MKIIKSHLGILKRICALVLCTAILIGIMPQVPIVQANAADVTQSEALNRLVEWGIMRGDQYGNLAPERAITRAEFVTMLNRTFGYTKTGSEPFKDVNSKDWFYDDIRIAYQAGYFTGNTSSTASPNSNLTREAAVVMICRNIMLKEQSGEDLSFTDSRKASDWSRGYIKSASEKGIVAGYSNGEFRPLNNITRGEVAILLARIIGTPVLDTGTYSNNVNGNLMINKSGITLDNMTVTGDLYITGGVGLGYVTLNNVHVYGQIIASGAGESNKGDCSIIIKNSSAPEMIVDSPSNQYVTIRTVGSTVIDKTYVRTDTYLEDKSNDGYGMTYIEVDGEEETKLDLSGNINEVVSKTPKSEINVGAGTVKTLTIDENATNSTVKIDQGASVLTMNLDVATTVEGKGDIGSLYVNAPGCKVEMLPDYIYIRPGITANINGTEMDSTLAQQMSDMPRILTGYPRSDDIAPTQITAKFETNKEGTIYWAVRLSGDGAMVAEDLIKPPSYGAKIVKSGKVSAKEANTVIEAKVSSLKLDTSYVLSAVLVDERGTNSLVKTLYFTTPDNSKPAFASGYPKTSLIEDTYVTFDVAASKNCTLYWAIYKKGMTAPIANDFKDNVLTGAIDSGTLRMIKSEEDSITMGNILEDAKNALTEYTDYDVYFFLSDGVNDSAIKKVSITTADRTPPEFLTNYPRISKIAAKALTGEAAINEDGKIYWAIVKHGTDYPVPDPNLDPNNPSDAEKIELYMKNQIKGGMYAEKSGSVSASEDAIKSINFSGLATETAYDIYFVAEDNHGNLSEIKIINNAKTLDSSAPILLEQKFSLANDKGIPLADTDITLVFDEDIYSNENRKSLYEMFNDISSADDTVLTTTDNKSYSFEGLINRMFVLSDLNAEPGKQVLTLDFGDDKFKDFINIKLTEDGYTEVTFKAAALPLKSGGTYQFTLNHITDSSNNNMGEGVKVDKFTVLNAQIDVNPISINTVPGSTRPVDTSFSMIPYANSTASAADGICYDIIITSDISIKFDVYRRVRTGSAMGADEGWEEFANCSITYEKDNTWSGVSLNRSQNLTINNYPTLKTSENDPKSFAANGYEFAIVLTEVGGDTSSDKWNQTINLKVFCIAGDAQNLRNLVNNPITDSSLNSYLTSGELSSVGNPADGRDLKIVCNPTSAPQFTEAYPQATTVGDSIVEIDYKLDRDGTVYYVIAPVSSYGDIKYVNNSKPEEAEKDLETEYISFKGEERNHNILEPDIDSIMNPNDKFPENKGYIHDIAKFTYGSAPLSIDLQGLKPNTKYYAFFVLKGAYEEPSNVMVYTFTTKDVVAPIITASGQGSTASYNISLNQDKDQTSVMANTYWVLYPYTTTGSKKNYPKELDDEMEIDSSNSSNISKGTTIIQALRTTMSGKKDNNFNLYATANDKAKLWAILTSPQTADPAAFHSGNKQGMILPSTDENDYTNTITFDDLSGSPHIFLVGAVNTQDSVGDYVFDLVDGISNIQPQYPRISNIIETITKKQDGTYSGSVTITFDKPLYVGINNPSSLPDEPTSVTTEPYSKYIQSDKDASSGFTVTLENESMLKITFSNVKDSYFTVSPKASGLADNRFYSQPGNPRPDNSPVSIRFQEVKNGDSITYEAVINGGYVEINGNTYSTDGWDNEMFVQK